MKFAEPMTAIIIKQNYIIQIKFNMLQDRVISLDYWSLKVKIKLKLNVVLGNFFNGFYESSIWDIFLFKEKWLIKKHIFNTKIIYYWIWLTPVIFYIQLRSNRIVIGFRNNRNRLKDRCKGKWRHICKNRCQIRCKISQTNRKNIFVKYSLKHWN